MSIQWKYRCIQMDRFSQIWLFRCTDMSLCGFFYSINFWSGSFRGKFRGFPGVTEFLALLVLGLLFWLTGLLASCSCLSGCPNYLTCLPCYPIPVCSKPKWIANSLSLSYPWHYSPEQLMCVANTPATLSTRRLRMLELLPIDRFKRPTARTRPAECEFNYEEMGKPSLLVASMKNIDKNYFRLEFHNHRKKRGQSILW